MAKVLVGLEGVTGLSTSGFGEGEGGIERRVMWETIWREGGRGGRSIEGRKETVKAEGRAGEQLLL